MVRVGHRKGLPSGWFVQPQLIQRALLSRCANSRPQAGQAPNRPAQVAPCGVFVIVAGCGARRCSRVCGALCELVGGPLEARCLGITHSPPYRQGLGVDLRRRRCPCSRLPLCAWLAALMVRANQNPPQDGDAGPPAIIAKPVAGLILHRRDPPKHRHHHQKMPNIRSLTSPCLVWCNLPWCLWAP